MTRVETIHNIIIEAAFFCRLKTCSLLPFLVTSSASHAQVALTQEVTKPTLNLRRALRFLVVVRGR